MQGKSKKAFSKNVETEMHSGKPQDQALAIAYSVKRKNKMKKASGGTVESGSPTMNYAKGGEISASNEKRPMPEDKHNDSKDVAQNDHKRSNGPDSWIGQPTVAQAQKNNGREVKPIKHPKMVASNVVQSRLRDEEDHLQSSASVNEGPQVQPPKHDDEERPDRQGPAVSDMEKQHNNNRKAYAAGGYIEERDLQISASPSEDEGDAYARSNNELMPDRQGPGLSDHEEPHSDNLNSYADGGEISRSPDDSEDQYDEEMAIDHAASIAAAIMAKRKFARGGAILSEDSMESFPEEDQADLSRNAEEDANMEDKASFDALRKEVYDEYSALEQADHPRESNLQGDSEEEDSENQHDRSLVSAIRRKMKLKSPISR